eukprot:CAMPEP_0170226532 /NCGR_PEP_ID=MMETSP0116_2-20130129/12977_1 /TAXON_ID=400756 /ORGANISM="Durinskia baltica, Strain CSIRO CS-38" /LENGTH=482 /DNA_ID=CAMNT_0010477257 /DNA_START=97 /DNA_END=1542 /DNA_ORIENTATION=+
MAGDEDLSALTVAQLKDKLKELSLPLSGSKADLIARIEANKCGEETKAADSAGHGDSAEGEKDKAQDQAEEKLGAATPEAAKSVDVPAAAGESAEADAKMEDAKAGEEETVETGSVAADNAGKGDGEDGIKKEGAEEKEGEQKAEDAEKSGEPEATDGEKVEEAEGDKKDEVDPEQAEKDAQATKMDKLSMSLDELMDAERSRSYKKGKTGGGGSSKDWSGGSTWKDKSYGGGGDSWSAGGDDWKSKSGSDSWGGNKSWGGGAGAGGGSDWKSSNGGSRDTYAGGGSSSKAWGGGGGGKDWGSGGGGNKWDDSSYDYGKKSSYSYDSSYDKSSWKDDKGYDYGSKDYGRSSYDYNRYDKGGRGHDRDDDRRRDDRMDRDPRDRMDRGDRDRAHASSGGHRGGMDRGMGGGEPRTIIVAGIGGLRVDRRDLERAFGTVGRVECSTVSRDTATLTFRDAQAASQAVRRFHGGQLNDRTIDVYFE